MDQPISTLTFEIEGRTIVALPRPEDQGQLEGLAIDGSSLSVSQSTVDTEGHSLNDEIAVDVEGHAMTLRLPNSGDAVAVRRALAAGALTASFVIGVGVASTFNQMDAPAAAIPAAAPVPVTQLDVLREERLAPIEAPAGPITAPAEITVPVAPAMPVTVPAANQPADLDTLREQRLAPIEAPAGSVDASGPAAAPSTTGAQQDNSGPLEFDR